MKKIISIILAVVLAFSTVICTAYATEDDSSTEPQQPISWEEYEEVATMYICATANSFTGHVWLYFENLTDCDIPIGYTVISPGEGMSVGSLRNTRKNGGGTYYNGEVAMANSLDSLCEHTYSIGMNLTPDQLKKENEKICKKNSYDMIFNNCGVFASTIWNSVSNKKIIHIVFPALTILSMLTNGADKGVLNMNKAQKERIYKQKKDGCIEASTDSFRVSCVNW